MRIYFGVISENKQQTQSVMEYLFLEVGEDIEIKVSAEHYIQSPSANRPCVADINYSASKVNTF